MVRGLLILIASVALMFDQYWLTALLVSFMGGCLFTINSAHSETVGPQDMTNLEYEASIDRIFGERW